MRGSKQRRTIGALAVASIFITMVGCGGQLPDPGATNSAQSAVGTSSTTGYASRGRLARRVQLTAEGTVDLRFVIPAVDAPPYNAPPPPPGLEYRARYTFPYGGDDVMDILIFAAPQGAPNGVDPVFVISNFRVQTSRFEISHTPSNNLMFSGRVIATPVPSPFGPLVGRLTSVTGGYTGSSNATFTLLGGPVSGSHTTELPTATGSLIIRDEDGKDD